MKWKNNIKNRKYIYTIIKSGRAKVNSKANNCGEYEKAYVEIDEDHTNVTNSGTCNSLFLFLIF